MTQNNMNQNNMNQNNIIQNNKKQLMVLGLKEKMINNLKNIQSINDSITNILFMVPDEAEQNLLKILNYCNEQFEYQCHYFDLGNTIFVPNIYRLKNDTFYICKFSDLYQGSDRKRVIEQFKQQYSNVKLRQLSIKQYRRILKWFRDDILFTVEKYKINFSKDNCRRIKCECCGKKFFTRNNNDRYCSEECAKNRQNKISKASKVKHYRDGYYMDIHHYVRSGWEHNIARILQYLQLDYDFECHMFTLSNGLVYIPDFYVYADNTYYEVKGEMRTNTLTKYNMFREEYPDLHFVIIDGSTYNDLLKQFSTINFDLHIPVIKSSLNNVIEYRHDKIHYKSWELDYKFYTNRRYVFNNIELTSTDVIKQNDLLYSYSIDVLDKIDKVDIIDTIDTIPETKLIDKFQTMQILNLTATRLKGIVSAGLINYYLVDGYIYFTKAFILEFQERSAMNRRIQVATIQNQLQLSRKLANSKTEVIIDDTINTIERNIMYILRFLNVDFTYESEALEYSFDKYIISKIYVPQENNYYFITPAYTQNYRNQLNELKTFNKNNINIVIIDQNIYDLLLTIFSKKIPQLIIQEHISIATSNQLNEIESINGSSYHRCLFCGKMLANKHKKYCSTECWTKARHKYAKQQCLNCGQEFQVLKQDQSYIYFCSDQCSLEYEQKHLHDNTIIVSECKHCKKRFVYLNKHKKHEFCSYNCAIQYQRNKRTKTYICKECGKEFTHYTPRVFCSTSCNAKWNYKHCRSINVGYSGTKIFPTSAYYMDIHHYVKNNWEHNIARILQINQLSYEYLPKQFKLSTGEILVISFYVAVDQKYYVITNTISVEKITQQIELVVTEYNINNICLIDKQVYMDLISHYLLKSLINHHIAVDSNNLGDRSVNELKNITTFDYNNMNYESWELDYKFYTNKRYLNSQSNIPDEQLENYVSIDNITNIKKSNVRQSLRSNKLRFSMIDDTTYLFKPDLEVLNITVNQNLEHKSVDKNISYKYTRECAYCGTVFKTNVANKKYCSNKCANKVASASKPGREITCSCCGKKYTVNYSIKKNKQLVCRDCYYKMLNTPEIKRRQANEMLIRNLSHIRWNSNDEHEYFDNEAKNNFALILEYLGNSYTYDDQYCYVDNDQFVYRYSFVRLKNNTVYVFHFVESPTIKQRFESFCKENPQVKIHIIDRKKYERILFWFRNKIKFTITKYPLHYYLEHKCPQCGKIFCGNFQQRFCSKSCSKKFNKKEI